MRPELIVTEIIAFQDSLSSLKGRPGGFLAGLLVLLCIFDYFVEKAAFEKQQSAATQIIQTLCQVIFE